LINLISSYKLLKGHPNLGISQLWARFLFWEGFFYLLVGAQYACWIAKFIEIFQTHFGWKERGDDNFIIIL